MAVKTRTIWMLAGLAWGLLVGLATALQTAAFLFGVGWLFVFGDDPWPAAAGPAILATTVLAGLVPTFLLAWLGRRMGIAFETEERQRLRARRRGWTVLALAVAAAFIGVSAAMAGSLKDRADRADRRAADRQLVSFSSDVHRLDESSASFADGRLRVPLVGEREGPYLLEWTVRESLYDTELDSGSRSLDLSGPGVEIVSLDLEILKEAYRDRVLSGAGGVLVDEDFEALVSLRPVLTDAEKARLPASAIGNLELGQSDLISELTVPVPVRFEIR